ncbi:MAG: hypothetical protein FJX46_14400 [Alphaproteobacteria bacterium]|nr:hypothetical protein [Alphaproteobacteria bacterium]
MGFLFVVLMLALGGAAQAQGLTERRWQPPGDGPALLAERPKRALESRSPLIDLGELWFRDPGILGGEARRMGLACNACHPEGAANRRFFIEGVSDHPGRFDPTNAIFNPLADDGAFAPVDIPSLRGVAGKSRFGTVAPTTSLRDFVRHVIVVEFMGTEPTPFLLDALLAYVRALPPAEDKTTERIGLAGAIDDLLRWGRAAATLLAQDGGADAASALAALRTALGQVHARFADPSLEAERAWIEQGGVRLGLLGRQAETGKGEDAAAALQAWLVELAARRPALLAVESRTLFDPVRLAETR